MRRGCKLAVELVNLIAVAVPDAVALFRSTSASKVAPEDVPWTCKSASPFSRFLIAAFTPHLLYELFL